eukprot:gene46620-60032_t
MAHLDTLMQPNAGSNRVLEEELQDDHNHHNASLWHQHFVNIVIALIFASAYPQQKYHTYVAAVSRAAVIYITSLFCGVLAMMTIVPVLSAERPAFYREQQSRMYSVFVYCLTLMLIE